MAFRRLNYACAAFAVAALMTFSTFSAKADSNAAQQVIQQSYAVLLDVMKDAKTLGYDGRVRRLAPAVEAAFNLPFMAQVTAGRFWDKANDDQRQRFVAAFGRMTTAALATRFDGYNGEQLAVLETVEKSPDSVVVKTEIGFTDGHKIPIDYVMKNFDGAWKVTDIYTMGSISEIAVKTADYLAVLQAGGVDALAGALNDKVITLAEAEKQSEDKTSP